MPRNRITRKSLRLTLVDDAYPEGVERPARRSDCAGVERPCPFVSCKHHLYLDVNPRSGSIKFNFPTLEPWELPETCALDVADRGGFTLDEVGELMNLSRERIRQVEVRGLIRMRKGLPDPDAFEDWLAERAQVSTVQDDLAAAGDSADYGTGDLLRHLKRWESRVEERPIREAVLAAVTSEPATTREIAKRVVDNGVTLQGGGMKALKHLRILESEGVVRRKVGSHARNGWHDRWWLA